MHIRRNLLFKKDFKSAEILTKTSFFLYVRNRSKNGGRIKWEVESICARVTKHASMKVMKAEVNMIDYEQLIVNCLDFIFYIHG